MENSIRITEGQFSAENIVLKGAIIHFDVTQGCVNIKAENILLDGKTTIKEEK